MWGGGKASDILQGLGDWNRNREPWVTLGVPFIEAW